MNKLWIILVVALFAGSAALRFPARSPQAPPRDDIQLHRDYWQSLHISHYSYALEISCLCGFTRQPYTFEIRDGRLISAVDGVLQPISPLDINAPPQSLDWFFKLTTIESLFDHAQDVSARAASVQILYDAQYGFPRLMYVDWSAGQVGGEIGLHVLNFHILP